MGRFIDDDDTAKLEIWHQPIIEVPPPVKQYKGGEKVKFLWRDKTHQGTIHRVIWPANGAPDILDYPGLYEREGKLKERNTEFSYVVEEHGTKNGDDPEYYWPHTKDIREIKEFYEEITMQTIEKQFKVGQRVKFITNGKL